MKKFLFISAIFMVFCSLFVDAQSNQPKLNQVESMKKLLGTWHSGNGNDTIRTFEMKEYNNAFMQINTSIINGVKRISFSGYYTYDKSSDNFKSLALYPGGLQQNWRTQFISEKEVIFDFVEDQKSNIVISRNTCTFDDPEQLTARYYNRDKVLTSTSKWIKTSSDGIKIFNKATQTEIKATGPNQLELAKKLVGVWQEQTDNDTVTGFEMSIYDNAVLETMYRTFKGGKELLGAINFIYDPKLDKFKGLWILPTGRIDSYYFKFSSDKEVVFERVEDFNSNKFMARNKFIFPDENHLNGTHYNRNEVQYGTSKFVKTSSGR